MKNIRTFIKSRLGFSLLSNIITIAVSLLFFRPYWEEADDINMALLVEGAFGDNEPHTLYFNYIYSSILCFLHKIMPAVRWHSVLMYAVVFAVSVTFVYLIAKDEKGKALSVIFLIGTFYEVYVALQFSKVATFIAVISYMIMFEFVDCQMTMRRQSIVAVIAFLGATFSHILRWESFGLATMVAGCFGVFLMFYLISKGEFLSRMKSYCAFFIPVFAVFFICIGINNYAYKSEEWRGYRSYFESVAQIVDYHYNSLLYDVHGNELKEMGITENDAVMLITYESVGSVLPEDLMESVCKLDKKKIDIDFIKALIANIYDEFFAVNILAIATVMLSFLILVTSTKMSRKYLCFAHLAAQAFIMVLVLLYFQYSGRWSHRVVYSLVLAQFVLFVYINYKTEIHMSERCLFGTVLSVMLFACVGARLNNEFMYREFERESYDYSDVISYMENNKDKLFIGDVFTMIDYDKYNIFSAACNGQFDNYLSTDAVFLANSPIESRVAEKYGYRGPMDALLSRDERVILIDNLSPEVELTYCNEHGDGSEYSLTELDSAGDIRLYSIH